MDKVNRFYVLAGALLILIVGFSILFNYSHTWSYLFQGSSQHWEAQFVVRPSEDGNEVIYEGTIKPLTSMNVTQLTYKTDVVTSQPGGTLVSPLIEEGKPI